MALHLALVGCEVSDEELNSLPELPWAKTFRLQNSIGFTDADVAKLAPMKRLTTLNLSGTPITDSGLTALATAFPYLSYLDLYNTSITDAGLKHIAKVKNLGFLRLGKTQVTGSAFAELAPLTNLLSLSLGESPITNAGLANLPLMPSLNGIEIELTAIDDVGLKSLIQKAPNLHSFNLRGTQITDASVPTFTSLAKLVSLTITGTKMTKAGANAIKARFPKLTITGP